MENKNASIIKSFESKLDKIENVLMNEEVLEGGYIQKITRDDTAKVQKIWDILYEDGSIPFVHYKLTKN